MASAAGLDTFPKLLQRNVSVRGSRPAMREKDLGIWQTWTWADVAGRVEVMAAGLAALGLRRGDKILVVGDNRIASMRAMGLLR